MPRAHYERIGRTVELAFADRSCLKKKRHASRNIARDFAAKRKKTDGAQQEPYRCSLCGGWHLRTTKERKRA